VAVIKDASQIAGFFGFELVVPGVGRPLGHMLSDLQAVVTAPGTRWSWPALLQSCGLSVWAFTSLVQPQAVGMGARSSVHATETSLIDLRAGVEAYLRGRRRASASLLSTCERKKRKLDREVGPVRLVQDADASDFAVLRRWKSAQYRRNKISDIFSLDWAGALVQHTSRLRSDSFGGGVSMLYAGEIPVAGLYGVRSNGCLAYWFPAYDPAFAAYSPGVTLLLELVRNAPAAGVEVIDLGRGDESYKMRWRNAATPLAEGYVARPSAQAHLWRARTSLREALLRSRARGPAEQGLAWWRQAASAARAWRPRLPEESG